MKVSDILTEIERLQNRKGVPSIPELNDLARLITGDSGHRLRKAAYDRRYYLTIKDKQAAEYRLKVRRIKASKKALSEQRLHLFKKT